MPSVSERTKSDIYRDCLPLLNSGRLELLDHPRLVAQLASLERRTARGGKDSIDHPPGGHDDVVNAACGALVSVATHTASIQTIRLPGWGGPTGPSSISIRTDGSRPIPAYASLAEWQSREARVQAQKAQPHSSTDQTGAYIRSLQPSQPDTTTE